MSNDMELLIDGEWMNVRAIEQELVTLRLTVATLKSQLLLVALEKARAV